MPPNTVVRIGGRFDRAADLQARLRQAPSQDAQQAVAPTAQGPPPSRWSLKAIRASVPWVHGASLSGVWRVLQRCHLKLRSARLRQFSPDPEYAAKERRLLECLRAASQASDTVAVVFLDEMGYFRWPDAAPVWSPCAPEPPVVTDPGGGNNRQWRVVGALNAVTGQLEYLENYMVGRRQLIQFYRQLDQAYAHVSRLYVVQDNWSIHQHPDVLAALTEWPRIEPVWLPTYAPWLNPIEKLWRWLRQDQLYVHRLAHDWATLRQRVNAFLDQFATGSHALLRYVGLLGDGKLARAIQPT